VWVSYVFYELDEEDEWVPQPAAAGIRPPTNCLFLDDAGNLRFNEDGTVDTSKRDSEDRGSAVQEWLDGYLRDTSHCHEVRERH
jgi:hypothetical protein